MPTQPRISVVLAVYNGERFLSAAVESVLAQTLGDFELIAVDDCSVDSTPSILANFAKLDSRLRVERNSKNRGASASRNLGIALARAELIAIMDADDISAPHRLEVQSAFLGANPDIGVLGSAVELIDDEGRLLGSQQYPLSPLAVRWKSFISAPFVHSTVMMRKSILTRYKLLYREEFKTAEDADMWSRLLSKTLGANLKQPLLHYRVHAASLTSVSDKTEVGMLRARDRIRNIRTCFPDIRLSDEDLIVLYNSFLRDPTAIDNQRARSALHYLVLWSAFKQTIALSRERQQLQSEVISTAAKRAFYPLFQPGSWVAFKALFALDRAWPLVLAIQMPKLIGQRILSLRLSRIRFLSKKG